MMRRLLQISVLVAAVAGLAAAAPVAAQRDHRLRGVVAARRLPADRRGHDVQLRRLEHAAAADRARSTGRRVRVGEPEGAAGALQGEEVRAARGLRDERPRPDRPEGQPRRHPLGLRASRTARRSVWRSARPASRSAATRDSCSRACGSAACSRRTWSATSRTWRASCRRSRSARRSPASSTSPTGRSPRTGSARSACRPGRSRRSATSSASCSAPGVDRAGAQAFVNKVRAPRGRLLLHAAGFGLPRR